MFAIPITVLLHIVVAVGLSLRVLYRKLAVPTTLAWIIIVGILPVAGVVLYFMFGDHRMGRKRLKASSRIREYYQKQYGVTDHALSPEKIKTSDDFSRLSHVIVKQTGFHPLGPNTIKLLTSNHNIFDALIADIENAKSSCFLEFYIVDPQGRAADTLEALIEAAKRGVDCKLLADDFGSKQFFRAEWPERLREAGVDVIKSMPVSVIKSFSKRSDLRNHRKIVVIDQSIGYIGSSNLADPKFFNQSKDVGEWVDILARIEGPTVAALGSIFNSDFLFDDVGARIRKDDLRSLPAESEEVKSPSKGKAVLQVIPSGPEMESSIIYETIVSAIFSAEKSITIITPYFVPDEAIVLAITNASRRGLDVTLILPRRIDSRMVAFASQSNFEELLDAGVKIALFEEGLLHTKVIIIDDDISLIGTVNMDMRSFYLNLEISMMVYDTTFNKNIKTLAEDYLKKSNPVDQVEWLKRPKIQQFKENVLRLVGPLL